MNELENMPLHGGPALSNFLTFEEAEPILEAIAAGEPLPVDSYMLLRERGGDPDALMEAYGV